jgi:hypothetical protein
MRNKTRSNEQFGGEKSNRGKVDNAIHVPHLQRRTYSSST